mmetsp:Transcript_41178/g.66239  ORF Transcript_41178/g.66239 Transcript_41178/m.66239 type:complete len:120 (+) Transcript_41178:1069-1428(+)
MRGRALPQRCLYLGLEAFLLKHLQLLRFRLDLFHQASALSSMPRAHKFQRKPSTKQHRIDGPAENKPNATVNIPYLLLILKYPLPALHASVQYAHKRIILTVVPQACQHQNLIGHDHNQ